MFSSSDFNQHDVSNINCLRRNLIIGYASMQLHDCAKGQSIKMETESCTCPIATIVWSHYYDLQGLPEVGKMNFPSEGMMFDQVGRITIQQPWRQFFQK